jgi:O-antigen ligase
MVASLFVAGFLVAGAGLNYLKDHGVDLNKMLDITGYTANNQSTYIREILYHDAWQQYLNHPIVGSSFVEENSRLYPHNIVIESFMATGTFGGSCFVLLILISLWRSFKLIKRAPEMAWVPICYMQYLLGAMFSGGIYANVLLWGMLGIVLGVDIPDDYSLVIRPVFRSHHAAGPQVHGVG